MPANLPTNLKAPKDLKQLMQAVIDIAVQAGQATMPYWHQTKELKVSRKADNSPLTQADLSAHQTIAQGLAQLTPDIPLLSEEGEAPDFSQRQQWDYYWLIDPLDGTRGFIEHSPEYSVNIALIHQHQSIMGVVYAPVTEECYFAWQNAGAFKQLKQQAIEKLHAQAPTSAKPLRIIIGQSHCSTRLEQFIAHHNINHQLMRLNSSLKFCYLAEGRADLYPRLGPTSEWDSAAGQCVLTEAGGVTVDFSGKTLQYNSKSSLLNPEFLASTDPNLVEQWKTLLKQTH